MTRRAPTRPEWSAPRWHRRLVGSIVAAAMSSMLSVPVATAGEPPDGGVEARLAACFGCHGKAGAGVVDASFPRLAGQPAPYLAAQLRAFRDGRRGYPPMNYLLSRLGDAYLDEMADYFSRQRPDPAVVDARARQPVDAALFEEGRRIVHDGRAESGLPPCVACHGVTLTGTMPSIPALAGLPRDLMVEQVGSWKAGTHRSPEPNCMATVAKRMTGADIVAAATWLSRQQPADAPAAASAALPIPCGTAAP